MLSWTEWEGHSTSRGPALSPDMPEYKDRVATGRVKLSVDLECEEQAGRSGVIGKQPPVEPHMTTTA